MRTVRTLPQTFLPLILAACASTSSEPATFNVELISFEAASVPLPLADMGAIDEPGYVLKFRREALINLPNNPDRFSYNIALIDCDSETNIFQSAWLYLSDETDAIPAIYEAPFYKRDLDRLKLQNPLCARVLIGKRKIETKGVGFETVKRPVLVSNKMQLQLPN